MRDDKKYCMEKVQMYEEFIPQNYPDLILKRLALRNIHVKRKDVLNVRNHRKINRVIADEINALALATKRYVQNTSAA